MPTEESAKKNADAGTPADTQYQLVQALLAPGCYDHAVVRIRHLETHISHLLLTGAYAYKIKKPLNLGFLDFSTLEQRHFYCTEELRLNRRLAPKDYLDVVAICGSPRGSPHQWRRPDTRLCREDASVRTRRHPRPAG